MPLDIPWWVVFVVVPALFGYVLIFALCRVSGDCSRAEEIALGAEAWVDLEAPTVINEGKR